MRVWRWCIVLAMAVALSACAPAVRLGGAPNVYSNIDYYPEAEVPQALRSVTPTLFYVTDRAPAPGGGYGSARSDSMVFGAARLRFGDGLDWPGLLEVSVRPHAGRGVPLALEATDERVRFPATPLPFAPLGDGRVRVAPEAQADWDAQARAMQAQLRTAILAANRREVVLFVHGFRNSFEDGHATLANIWHFSGRVGVPLLFSWPANNPGLFGYFKDRESGEFSVFHLKQVLTILAGIDELERIHIVAHSRGADIATTALREMVIAERAAGRNPRATLKVENLILAAPDIDFGVVRQRLVAERFAPAFGQITVYLNPRDGALGLAQTLMSGVRMGRLTLDRVDPRVREVFARIGNVHFVDVERPGKTLSHAYFRANPAVVSDIVLTIRTGAAPGGADRPLERFAGLEGPFWSLHPDYPDPRRIAALWEAGQHSDDDR